MLSYLFTRLLTGMLSVVGVITLVFLLIHFVPGDPVEMMLGESALPADREALRESLGLNKTMFEQYTQFVSGVFTLDLGNSIQRGSPITEIIAQRLPATAELALAALVVALLIALPLGAIAATRKGSGWDATAMTFSLIGVSIPNFWMGQILILIFAMGMGLLPISGRDDWSSIILPAFTLGTALAAILARMVRSTLLEVIHEDYIRTARAKGLPERRVIFLHAMQNALLPIITLLGLQLGTLLAGAVITEKVFSWPGIGLLTVEAIQQRDYPLVQACVLLISLIYVVVNLLTDVVYAWVDPRIRLTTEKVG